MLKFKQSKKQPEGASILSRKNQMLTRNGLKANYRSGAIGMHFDSIKLHGYPIQDDNYVGFVLPS